MAVVGVAMGMGSHALAAGAEPDLRVSGAYVIEVECLGLDVDYDSISVPVRTPTPSQILERERDDEPLRVSIPLRCEGGEDLADAIDVGALLLDDLHLWFRTEYNGRNRGPQALLFQRATCSYRVRGRSDDGRTWSVPSEEPLAREIETTPPAWEWIATLFAPPSPEAELRSIVRSEVEQWISEVNVDDTGLPGCEALDP